MAGALALGGVLYAAIAPLLPAYVAAHGLSEAQAGLLVGAYPAGTLLATVPAARAAGRLGPKVALLGGLTALGVATLAFGVLDAAWPLTLARFVQGVGCAFAWIGGLAWVLEDVPAERKGGVVGVVLAAPVIGVTVGPMVGGLAAEVGTGPVFVTVAVACFVLAWGGSRGVPNANEVRHASADSRRMFSERIVLAAWIVCLGAGLAGATETLVPLRLDQVGLSGLLIGVVFFAMALIEAILSPRAGSISDRRGRFFVIRFGIVVGVVVSSALAASTGLLAVVVATWSLALALAALATPAVALLSDAAEALGLNQATAAGLYTVAWSGGGVLGSLAGGALASIWGWSAPFIALAALAAATLTVVELRAGHEPVQVRTG